MTPVLPIAGQKFPRYFDGYLEFFAVFQNFYLFIPRFLAKPWLGNTVLTTRKIRHMLYLWNYGLCFGLYPSSGFLKSLKILKIFKIIITFRRMDLPSSSGKIEGDTCSVGSGRPSYSICGPKAKTFRKKLYL
jgi:hypothetical protein